ncbi:phenylacetate--CoA ligase family protein [Rhodocyclus gracilis]|uniref:Phenylacetate-coenzyme A ligase n=1 Tax=Rhodocyclus tenuis TaxID=1066 RepID=A0A6L5JVQ1_RHOTE|nr:phenylacetate--CoA ligase [Rhodocyclus gracilis]MQY51319.1 AMP-binding protein [Rhodocyclus gracilis]
MFYDAVEVASRDELAALQTEGLRRTVATCLASPFYRRRLGALGVGPEDFNSPLDIRKLPFTTKDDLRAGYPDGFLCQPREDFIRLHVSSGTTGAPTAVFYTANDVAAWANLVARCMHAVGLRRGDVFQNMSGYGLFTGGLGIHYGAERLGCLTVPAGAGNSKRQLKLLRDFKVDGVHIIPSYALHFGQFLRQEGVDPADLGWRFALIGAEPHTERTRRRIEEVLGLKAFNSYGLTEMNGPGVAFECAAQAGMHVWEDAYLAEIVDPQTGAPLPDGETGELVMTTLGRDGMPLLRYRTRDLTRFIPGECACGRTHRRLDRITGRTDDMIIIKGCNIFPMQIEQVLMAMPEVANNYLIELYQENDMDQIRVKVEVRDEVFAAAAPTLAGLHKRMVARLRDEVLVTPAVELVRAGSIPAAEGKAVRVEDHRLLEPA